MELLARAVEHKSFTVLEFLKDVYLLWPVGLSGIVRVIRGLPVALVKLSLAR